ncbi:MAG: hypothetical protein J5995_02495 [Muribaculaceae bacterium]|nr:hypothetical protein [Muribaculaceae bacterium]
MKKILSVAVMGIAALAATTQNAGAAAPVNDFVPKVEKTFFQELWDNEIEGMTTQVRIEVRFDEDVWWVSGASKHCYVLDKDGNKYEDWKPDFAGAASDYAVFYYCVNGINKYEDADYTLVIPEGLYGNPAWHNDNTTGRVNPELRYDFNVWKLAGQPREDKTAYDFAPLASSYEVVETRINGQKTLELQLALDFAEPVAIHKNIDDKCSVRDSEGNSLQEAKLRYWVDETNPNKAYIGLRGVDLKNSVNYTISAWIGAFGTLEWEKEEYCEGHASPELEYVVNPSGEPVIPAPVADFVPEVQNMFYQEVYDQELDDFTSQVRIEVKFDEDVWWVSGASKNCYLLDKDGKVYEDWKRDFAGSGSDYSVFYYCVNGLNKYEDADYTLVIPEGLYGNPAWHGDPTKGRVNPELRYEFNAWKLAGQPREDKTAYDFMPASSTYELVETRINGKKTLELQLALDFTEPVAIHKSIDDKCSVRDSEGNSLQEAVLRYWVDETDPNRAYIGLRGVDLKSSVDYTISAWIGAFGTLEWEKEEYCEGHASPQLIYTVNPKVSAVESVNASDDSDTPVYNLQGVRMNADKLQKGIYIRGGKKFVVK